MLEPCSGMAERNAKQSGFGSLVLARFPRIFLIFPVIN